MMLLAKIPVWSLAFGALLLLAQVSAYEVGFSIGRDEAECDVPGEGIGALVKRPSIF